MTDKIDTAELLSRIDIVQVIDAYVPLKKSGAEYEVCCPFHTEDTPSFKVSPTKQIYHCFGCGANGDAIGFLMQYQGVDFKAACAQLGCDVPPAGSGSVPVPRAAERVERKEKRSPWLPIVPAPDHATALPSAHYARGKPVAQWPYRDGTGRLLGCVYRFIKSDGGKEVLPVVWAKHEDTGAEEWRWMAFPEPHRPLYGLDRLAAKPDATVLLVEGEKCADAGHAELPDLAVVSWPGGGKADGKVDWTPLSGRKVMTWADADAKREPLTPAEKTAGIDQASKPLLHEEAQPGFQTMARIREKLRSLDCKLWDVKLPPPGSKPDGWDIADAVMEGLKGRELAEYVRANARSAVPRMTTEQAEQLAMASLSSGTAHKQNAPEKRSTAPLLVNATDWLDAATPMEWVVDGIIQRGCLYAMTAVTNHGKTAIGLLMAMCIASGKRFAGLDIVPGKVLILCGENPDGFRTRMKATMESLGLEREDIAGLVTVLPQALPLAGSVQQILEEARRVPGDYSMVLVDTSISYYSGDDEDDNLQARTHAWNLRALAELPGRPAIVANCHPTKSADRENLLPRGGGAFLNEIDTNLTVWAEGETAQLHWHRKKRGPDFDPIPFEFQGKSIEEHGRKVPTVYASHITDQRERELRKARTQADDRLLYAMLHHPDSTYAEWASACGWNGEQSKSKVYRSMNRLKDDQLVKKYRGSYKLTKLGEEEAKRIH
jgi:RecA-family ATPase